MCSWFCVRKFNLFFSTFSQTQNQQAEFSFVLAPFPNIVCLRICLSFPIPHLLNGVGLQEQNEENLILVLCEALGQMSKHLIRTGNEINVSGTCA